MIFLVGIFLFLLSGWYFLSVLRFRGVWYEKLALSFLITPGITSFLFFFYAKFTDSVVSSVFWIISVCLCLIFFCFSPRHKGPNFGFKALKSHFSNIPKATFIFWTVIVIITLVMLTYAAYFPVYTTDSLHLYDFRAKVMFGTKTLSAVPEYVQTWSTYPLYTSFINLFMRFLHVNPPIYYPLMYFSFAVIFYARLHKSMNSIIASLGTLLMYTSPLILWQSRLDGLSNLPYTIFFSLGILYFLPAIATRPNWTYLFVSVIMMALSNWTRINEPFWVIPLIIFFLRFWKRLYILPVALIYFNLAKLSNTIWVTYVRSSSHVTISKGADVLIRVLTESEVPSSSSSPLSLSAQVGPIQMPNSMISLVSLVLQRFWIHLSQSFTFLSISIVPGLSPVIYIFPLVLVLHIVYGHTPTQRRLLFCILLSFLILWVGTLYASFQFDYWLGLGNAVSRISGFLIPIMWMYIFQFEFWNQLSWFRRP